MLKKPIMLMMNHTVVDRECCFVHSLFLTRLIKSMQPRVILLDPAGRTFDQSYAEELAQEDELILSVAIMKVMMNVSRLW